MSKPGRHSAESPRRFWTRTIAGGSFRSLRSFGGLVAAVSVGGVVSSLIGGLWYLAIGDIVGDRSMAATSAIAGAAFIWIFVTVAVARAMIVGERTSSDRNARGRRRGR